MLIYENGDVPQPSTHIFGQFTVNAITYGPSGDIQELDVDFQQSNIDWDQSVSGHIQFSAAAPATSIGVLQGASDPGGTPLTAVLVSPPQHGTLRLDDDGGFVYQPAADFYGMDSFQYLANDGVVGSPPATALIDVARVHQAVGRECRDHARSEYQLHVPGGGFHFQRSSRPAARRVHRCGHHHSADGR